MSIFLLQERVLELEIVLDRVLLEVRGDYGGGGPGSRLKRVWWRELAQVVGVMNDSFGLPSLVQGQAAQSSPTELSGLGRCG